jgi:hypothetical protein
VSGRKRIPRVRVGYAEVLRSRVIPRLGAVTLVELTPTVTVSGAR